MLRLIADCLFSSHDPRFSGLARTDATGVEAHEYKLVMDSFGWLCPMWHTYAGPLIPVFVNARCIHLGAGLLSCKFHTCVGSGKRNLIVAGGVPADKQTPLLFLPVLS